MGGVLYQFGIKNTASFTGFGLIHTNQLGASFFLA